MSEPAPTAAAQTKPDALEPMDEGTGGKARAMAKPNSPVRRVTLSPETVASNKRSLADCIDIDDNESNGSNSAADGAIRNENASKSSNTSDQVKPEAEEDEDDEPQVMERPSKKARTRVVARLGPLPMPNQEEQQVALGGFESPSDRALQRLLWDIGCRYTMIAHQPEAVRAVAGIPEKFPRSANEDGRLHMSRSELLKSIKLSETKTKGLLLADEMGLGKTVEAVCGMILRNKWCHMHGKRGLPSLVIAPNDAVLKQWYDTLVKAGVSESRIRYFKPKSTAKLEGNIFVLMTRYNIQSVVKSLFGKVDMRNRDHPSAPLFPVAPKTLLHKLKNQYLAEKGKAKNLFKERGETEAACITRYLKRFVQQQRFERQGAAFRAVIIDEAHFLKNLCSYWGIGTALLGVNAERMVTLTGTPYNNGAQDMASLMTFIDPTHPAAQKDWWDRATSKRTGAAVAEAISDWREDYMVLRKKDVVLKGKLPPKIIETMAVTPFMIELFLYEKDEERFLKVLESFTRTLEDNSPKAKRRQLELFSCAMAYLANMRKDLIHPMLSVGREISIRFSPSRAHLLPNQEKKKQCVCCKAFKDMNNGKDAGDESDDDKKPPAQPKDRRPRVRNNLNMNLEDADEEEWDDDDEEDFDEDDNEDASKGPIIPLPVDLCNFSEDSCRHFAHEHCIEAMREDALTCPVCKVLHNRVHLVHTRIGVNESGETVETDEIGATHRTYCKNISVASIMPSGFKASAKIERVIAHLRTIPENEKVIIYSFFKGPLDLMEGVMTYDLGIGCARFDGDVVPEARNADLDRFKSDPSCRVLLATVQSGGTGLNIVEANNVIFFDRWFNPCVHAQAQDRCHRIGQLAATVKIFFADVATTVDEVMAYLNLIKANNATIVLADGSEIARTTQGNLTYKDLAGMVGDLVRAVRSLRQVRARDQYGSPLTLLGNDVILAQVEAAKKSAKAKKEEKSEGDDSKTSSNTASAGVTSSSSSLGSDAEAEDVEEKPRQIPTSKYQYATLGQRIVLDISDDSDDDFLDDVKPTFKSAGNDFDDDDDLLKDVKPTFKSE